MTEKYKILCCGNLHVPHASENLIYRQLERDGHDVEKFIYPTIAGTNYPELNKKLLNLLDNEKFDLMIASKCMGMKKEDIEKIKIPKVSWVYDLFKGYNTWNRSEWYEAQAPYWDYCFGAEAGQVEYYNNKGINYSALKLGADPDWHNKIPYNTDYDHLTCDVSFLGGVYNPLRINMASRIQCIQNIKFNNFVGYELHGQTIPGVYMKQISQLATVCKISIGCNYRNDIEGYWSKRPYEVMGSNMFMIQAYVKGMEDEGFKDKVNTIFYHDDNFEEMAEKIEYYLRPENQAERERIKEAGFQLIHKSHMMSDRTKEFFKILKQNKVI